MKISFCPRSRCWDAIHLEWVCPDAIAQTSRGRTFGVTVTVGAGVDLTLGEIRLLLDDALIEGRASDSWGNSSVLPDDTEFQVHAIRQRNGDTWYSAIYSGEMGAAGRRGGVTMHATPEHKVAVHRRARKERP